VKTENLDIPSGLKKKYIDEGITELNPPQEQAVNKGLTEGEDLIVASPTASGKTFIAELGISKKAVEQGKTAIYIVPLKALASEKYEDFSERYENLNVQMTVGNSDDAGEYLDNADIVIVTSEKMDSMLRHNPSWIHDIGLVVVDEIHLLTSENRGPTLEVTLTRLRELLDFQLLGLSATISNASEMADWLDSTLVKSDYRPVELKHGVYWDSEVEFFSGNEDLDEESELETPDGWSTGADVKEKKEKQESETEVREMSYGESRGTENILRDTLEKEKQAITFCNSRKGAEKESDRAGKITEQEIDRQEGKELEEYADKILNALGSPTSQCKRLAKNVKRGAAFHHAGLVQNQRKAVEEAFKKGLIKNISATPTLAAGVNLPAYRVIIRDLKRYTGDGMDFIPVLEYEQMCLPYEQKILLSNGERRPIGEIVESDEDLEVLSFNEQNGRVEGKTVTERFENGHKETLEIETETGTIVLTEDHPILVKKDSEDEWLEAGKVSQGDLIRIGSDKVQYENPYFYSLVPNSCYGVNCGDVLEEYKKEFDLTDKEIANNLSISDSAVYHYRNDKKAVPIRGVLKACEELGMSRKEIGDSLTKVKSSFGNVIEIPEHVNEDFMWLVGIILTDGNLNKTEDNRHGSNYTSIRVFNTNKDIIEKAKNIFNSLGLECYQEEREKGKYRLDVGNTLLAEILKDKFTIPYGKKSDKTKIPEIIFRMPESLQASFIEGLFDGDGSLLMMEDQYKYRIHFSTSSEKFADDLRELLAGFGVKSQKDSKFVEDIEIDGAKYEVNKKSYSVRIRSKDSFNKLASVLNPVKADIEKTKYSDYNNSNNHRKQASDYTEVISTKKSGKKKGYNIEVEDNHNYLTSSREILHNCGRAGRPKYDDEGQAISIAKQPGMKQDILERYILGEAERIQSKLNVEPVLRMHTLALIASKFCSSMDELVSFYEKTFYAHQFGDMSSVEEKIRKVVDTLDDYDFVDAEAFEATKIGRKVSDLYIDPDSAHLMLKGLERADGSETRDISYLFMLSRTSELSPKMRVKDKEWSEYERMLMDAEPYLLEETPQEWDVEYETFMNCMKTAMMMNSWISEMDEEQIMNEFGIAPGGIRAKMQNADWLLYSSKELARMKGLDVDKDLEKLRIRLKHGIDEELLSLVKYDQIGRVRARKLYDYGIRNKRDIKEVNFEKLKKLIGKKTAGLLKEQVGEENYFDRENIMDYFD